MKIFLCLLIKFYILSSCGCDACVPEDTECDPDVIYLLESDDQTHRDLNEKFIESVLYNTNQLDKLKLATLSCSDGLMGAIQTSKNCLHVIHLYVPDFYYHNYNILGNNLIYVGDIGPGKTNDVCLGNSSIEYLQESHNYIKNCTPGVQPLHHVKLVSKPVEIQKDLIDIIKEINVNNTNHLKTLPTVLICEDESTVTVIKDALADLPIDFQHSSCNIEHEPLAILAPKPFTLEYDMTVPTVFYQDSYLMPDNNGFRNAVPLTRSWSNLANALLEFMDKMEWTRIAIISDDSPYSDEIQNHLTTLFDERQVIYIVKSCQEEVCDFEQALHSIWNSSPGIVFANVGEEYAEKLSIQSSGMISRNNILWIARDWSYATAVEAAQYMGDIFTVSLGPAINNYEPYYKMNVQNTESILKYSRIIEAAKGIANVYGLDKNENELSKQDYQRFFTESLRNTFKNVSNAYVIKTNPESQTQLIMTMKIHDEKVNVTQWESQFSYHKPIDMENCILRSNNYYKPCNNINVLLLMLVAAVFVVSLLALSNTFYNLNHSYTPL